MGPNKKKSKKGGGSAAKATPTSVPPPEDFATIIGDMCNDLSTTFPEYASLWQTYTKTHLESLDDAERTKSIQSLYDYCLAVYPERFFDILYKNADMFNADSGINVNFLPNVDFRTLFLCDGVSDNTRNVMWNYLQLILFTVIGTVRDKSMFGDTKNLFDGIDEGDLVSKLSETMENMTEFFQSMDKAAADVEAETSTDEPDKKESGEDSSEDEEEEDKAPRGFKFPKMPDMKELHQHLKSLFDGKIGSLAKELAEEITGDLGGLLGEDMKDVKTTKDVLQFLMKDPKKISGIIQKITEKLKAKMSSGDISQEELMKEATELLGKMKDMGGGMEQFKDMFKNMGIPIPKNAKIDMNALNRMTSHQSLRERLKKRMQDKKQAQQDAIQRMAASMQAAQTPQDIYELSKQLGLNLDSNEGIVGAGGAPIKNSKKGKK